MSGMLEMCTRYKWYFGCVGYVYAIFENDRQVKAMLQACTRDFRNGGEYYFKISSRRMKCKEVSWLKLCSLYLAG